MSRMSRIKEEFRRSLDDECDLKQHFLSTLYENRLRRREDFTKLETRSYRTEELVYGLRLAIRYSIFL